MTIRRLVPLLFFLAAASGHAAPAKIAMGAYECWGNGQARMMLNFTIRSAAEYVGSDNETGNYRYNASSGVVNFTSGALDGVMPEGFISVYHENKGKPTVSFRSGRGAEASFCEKVGK